MPASGVPAVLGRADSLPGTLDGVFPAFGVCFKTFEITAEVFPACLAAALAAALAPPFTFGADADAPAFGAATAFPTCGTTTVFPCLKVHSPAPPATIP